MRILVLDDEVEVCRLLRECFTLLGAEVVCTAEAEEALALLELRRFDALVADLRLGSPYRTEGLEIVAEARYRSPRLRIVVHTGTADPALHEDCIRRGADAIVIKSEPLSRLREAVYRAAVEEEVERVSA
jgi:CheY-like chemotaxis protein